MSFQITTAFRNTYARNIMMLAQQKGSRLRSSVMVESGRLGEKHFVDQIGSITPVEVTDRHGDSPQIDTPHERRLLTVRDFEFGDIIDDPDLVRTLDSPQNKYVQAYSMGFGRQMDQTIIDNGLGASFSGKDGTVSNSLGVANISGTSFKEANLSLANLDGVRGAVKASGLETTIVTPDAKYFNKCERPWLERKVDWEQIRKVGNMQLFTVSYTLFLFVLTYFSAIGYFKFSPFFPVRTGKCARNVSKKFAFEEGVRKCGTVDLYKRLPVPR